jgi:hypothetical protein
MHVKHFSSANLPAHLTDAQRFALWYALYRDLHGGAEVSISESVPFSAAIETTDVGAITLGRMSGTITRATRSPQHVAAEGRNDYALLLNCGQPVSCSKPGLEIDIPTGAGLFVGYDESFTIAGACNGDGSRWLNVVLPRALLDKAFAPTGELSAQAIRPTESLNLLFGYIQLLHTSGVASNDLVGPCHRNRRRSPGSCDRTEGRSCRIGRFARPARCKAQSRFRENPGWIRQARNYGAIRCRRTGLVEPVRP